MSDDQSDDSETSWQKVTESSVKRMRKINFNNPPKRQVITEKSEYYNKYNLLTQDDVEIINKNETTNEVEQNITKPPPIVIPHVNNIKLLIDEFNQVVQSHSYKFKTLRDGQIRLMMADIKSYREIIKHLDKKNRMYYTYQPKNDRCFRVVIKNLDYTTPIDDIKTELLGYGHDARYITNIKSRITKERLPIFFVDLEPKENNKDVYNIKYVNNVVVKIEPPRKFDDLVQCHRCQEFGHTKSFCKKRFQCVNCGLGHPTTECSKPANTPARCIHCLGNHTANYRSCEVYLESLRRRKNVQQTTRQNTTRQLPIATMTSNTTDTNGPHFSVQPFSYANVTKDGTSAVPITNIQSNINKLENMMEKQIELMNTLISMMSLLMNKLCK